MVSIATGAAAKKRRELAKRGARRDGSARGRREGRRTREVEPAQQQRGVGTALVVPSAVSGSAAAGTGVHGWPVRKQLCIVVSIAFRRTLPYPSTKKTLGSRGSLGNLDPRDPLPSPNKLKSHRPSGQALGPRDGALSVRGGRFRAAQWLGYRGSRGQCRVRGHVRAIRDTHA